MRLPLLMLAVSLISTGCAERQVYDNARGARQAQCRGLTDQAEWQRCMEAADRSYDSYRLEMPKQETQ